MYYPHVFNFDQELRGRWFGCGKHGFNNDTCIAMLWDRECTHGGGNYDISHGYARCVHSLAAVEDKQGRIITSFVYPLVSLAYRGSQPSNWTTRVSRLRARIFKKIRVGSPRNLSIQLYFSGALCCFTIFSMTYICTGFLIFMPVWRLYMPNILSWLLKLVMTSVPYQIQAWTFRSVT